MDSNKHPDEENPIRAPYLPLAVSKKIITTLLWCSILLTFVTIVLAISFSISIQKKPWVVADFGKGYEEVILQRNNTTAQDIERYLNFILPNLYGSLNGEAPGLQELRGLINEGIIAAQEQDLETNKKQYKNEGISVFALVTGIKPDTLVINKDKNFVYVEALGTIVLSQSNNSKNTPVQWRCLLYIVEPTDSLTSKTPAGRQKGNKMGLYLQQIGEQEPNTVNQDIPK